MSKISMLNHIKTIPELMKMRMNEQDDIDYVLKNVYQKDSIAIIASGSSYNAAHEIKLFAEKIFNIHVELYYPNYFLRNYGEKNIDVDKLEWIMRLEYHLLHLLQSPGHISFKICIS